MKRLVIGLCAVCTAAALGTAAPAGADPATLGTSYAAAANITPGSTLTPVTTENGDIADLLDFLAPVEDQFVNPLSTALGNLPSQVVSNLQSDLGTSLVANSTSDPQAAPARGTFPDCSDAGWTGGNCFAGQGASNSGGDVADLDVSKADGWAAADASGSTAASTTSLDKLEVLGVQVGDLGASESGEHCADKGACSGTSSLAGLNLLGGAVQAKVTDSRLLVSVDGGDYTAAADVSSQSVSGQGETANVSSDGDTVKVAITVSLDQLSEALGVTDDLADLNAAADPQDITLDVFLNAGGVDQSGRSAGLQVGLGLAADINASVFGLVGDELVVTDDNGGNLAQLQLGFTAATSPQRSGSGSSDAPPELI